MPKLKRSRSQPHRQVRKESVIDFSDSDDYEMDGETGDLLSNGQNKIQENDKDTDENIKKNIENTENNGAMQNNEILNMSTINEIEESPMTSQMARNLTIPPFRSRSTKSKCTASSVGNQRRMEKDRHREKKGEKVDGHERGNNGYKQRNRQEDERIEMTDPKLNSAMLNLLPTFSGEIDENPKYFLAQFRNIAELAKINKADWGIIIRSKLRGKAQTWLHANVGLQIDSSFQSICTELMEYFDIKKSMVQSQAEFQRIKQGTNMSVRELAMWVRNSAYKFLNITEQSPPKAKEIADQILFGKFVQALREDVSKEVQKMGATTFKEAIEMAERVESALQREYRDINNITSWEATAEAVTQETQIALLTAEVNALKMHNIGCHRCGDTSHFQKDCPKNNRKQGQDRFCLGCGDSSHLLINCKFVQNLTKNLTNSREERYGSYQQQNYERENRGGYKNNAYQGGSGQRNNDFSPQEGFEGRRGFVSRGRYRGARRFSYDRRPAIARDNFPREDQREN